MKKLSFLAITFAILAIAFFACKSPVLNDPLTGEIEIDNMSPAVGDILDITYTGNGTGDAVWQIQRDSESWEDIAGDSDINTYTVVPGDADMVLKFRVSFTENSGWITSEETDEVLYPALTGTISIDIMSPEVGDDLEIIFTGNGTGAATWEIQRASESWVALTGTGSSIDYHVIASDLDKTLRFRVSFANQDGIVTSGPTSAVVPSTLPALEGTITLDNITPAIGDSIDVSYAGNGTGTITWRIHRSSGTWEDLPQTTNPFQYTVTSADLGETLRFRVHFSDYSSNVESETTSAVVLPTLTGSITVSSSSPQVGNELTIEYSGNGTGTASWEIRRGSSGSFVSLPDTGNSISYTVLLSDNGSNLTFRVSFTDQADYVVSETTSNVSRAALTGTLTLQRNGAAISATNRPAVGDVLDLVYTGGNGIGETTWNIRRRTGTTGGNFNTVITVTGTESPYKYTVTTADVGQRLTFQVQFAGNTGNVQTAELTANLPTNPPLTGNVIVSSMSPTVGNVLTISHSDATWVSHGNATWQISRNGGTSWATIPSLDPFVTYTVVHTDVGNTLTFRVSFAQTFGNVVSGATAAVAQTVINVPEILGVSVPIIGGSPSTQITGNAQYTGTVAWTPDHTSFQANQSYTATITLTAVSGYTLTGVAANFFTVAGTSSAATSTAGTGVITAVFPVTGSEIPPPVLKESGVWFETAWAEWVAVSHYNSFNARIRLNSGAWQNVDWQLVRKIGADAGLDIWRVDVPGLRNTPIPGTLYDLQIRDEDNNQLFLIEGLVPVPFDRQGYAFAPNPSNPNQPANGITTGGYNADGTVHASAQIFYVTQETMNSVLTAGAFSNRTAPTIIRLIGQVGRLDFSNGLLGSTLTDMSQLPIGITRTPNGGSANRMYVIENSRNLTIEGIGPDAYIEGWGIRTSNNSNVVIRNFKIDWWFDDAIEIATTNASTTSAHIRSHTWVNHIHFGYGLNRTHNPSLTGDNDHLKGDGATDITNGSTHFTVSYNIYEGSGKSMLIGGGTGATIGFGTLHHNWFIGTEERTPRVRNGWIHVFNNTYDHVGGEPGQGGGYGIGAGHRANIVAEGNTFIRTFRPFTISGELSGIAAGPNPDGNLNTLSGDHPGIILTSLYNPSQNPAARTMQQLTGRTLVPNELDAWSRGEDFPAGWTTQWYFPDTELVMPDGASLTNNRTGNNPAFPGAMRTYAFVPFHEAVNYRTDGSTQGPAVGTWVARAPLNDTLSSLGVQSAAAAAARVQQYSGNIRVPAWRAQ